MKTFNNRWLDVAILFMTTSAVSGADEAGGWLTLFDGTNLEAWNQVGDANWRIADDTVSADAGAGMLVSKRSFSDFELKLEFWADPDTNSGVFLRCADAQEINPANCYEVNIFDNRPDQSGRTGAIVDVAPPRAVINTEGRWNTYEILAEGTHLVVKLNGTVTVDTHDEKLSAGPFTLQYAAGGVKFRNVRIRPF
jgi:hypothetical protein